MDFGLIWFAIIIVGVVLMGAIVLGSRGRGGGQRHRPSTDSAVDGAVVTGIAASTLLPDAVVDASGGASHGAGGTNGDRTAGGGSWADDASAGSLVGDGSGGGGDGSDGGGDAAGS